MRGMHVAAIVLASNALVAGLATRGPSARAGGGACEPEIAEARLEPSGSLVQRYEPGAACAPAVYEGAETALYADRDYHSEARVAALAGWSFCRTRRHETRAWIANVAGAVELRALATPRFALEERGWEPIDAPVRVAAAGVELDRLYRRRLEPGRYVFHRAYSRTTIPVFWPHGSLRGAPAP